MRFETLSDFSAIGKNEWNQLLIDSEVVSPFMCYGYQHTWWLHKGGGEWHDAELKIVVGYENDQLIGIAPLFQLNRNNKDEIHFVGSVEISDYLDFIVSADWSEKFIRGVLEHLNASAQLPLKMNLFNIADDSPTIDTLGHLSKEGSWDIEITKAYHTPTIELADTWDTYLAGINKKQRHEIRRKIRRAENAEEDSVAWNIADQHENLDLAISEFFHLMILDPEKKKFLTDEMRAQMQAIIHWAAEEDILQLSFLTINAENAAGYLCFDYADRIWVYNSGFSPNFQYYSPGWVLLSYLIQHAINGKKTYFDFMRGDESYKYRFGAMDSFVMKAVIKHIAS